MRCGKSYSRFTTERKQLQKSRRPTQGALWAEASVNQRSHGCLLKILAATNEIDVRLLMARVKDT